MKFIKYDSIDNLTDKLAMKLNNKYHNKLFVVTPKIDGSNFAIMFDDDGKIVPAKRSSTLSDDSAFFNFQRVIEKYGEAFYNIRNRILRWDEGKMVKYVSLHGELCGGYYPGSPNLNNVKRVQKRVAYSNDTEFVMFDIRAYLHPKHEGEEPSYIYIPHCMLVNLCKQYGVPFTEILFTGELDQVIEWANKHINDSDTMWQQFGMDHEVANNTREGYVIKELTNNAYKDQDERVIFKIKHPRFGERVHKEKEDSSIGYHPELMKSINDSMECLNINRALSAISKFGECTIKDFKEIATIMYDDILEEIDLTNLDTEQEKVFKKHLKHEIGRFLGKHKAQLF